MTLLHFIIVPLFASFLAPFFKSYLKYISIAINLSLLLLAFSFIDKIPLRESISFNSPLSIAFVLNSASLFFIILFVSILTLLSLYDIKDDSRRDIFILRNILLASVSGVVLSGDIFNIYIFFEMVSITAYILTSLKRDKGAYSGAIRYMIMGTIASIFLLIGIMGIYLNIGTLNLVTIGEKFLTIDSKVASLILISLFIGFGIKVEIFPLNFWVVDIYQASTNWVNALFSSIVSKAYIFLFFHIAYTLKVDSTILAFLTTIGIISFAISEISALSSRDIKRIFAYSTLGQIGILFIGLSSVSVTALTGAIFLVAVHAITKFMLFLSLDILEDRFNSTKIEIFAKFNSLFLISIFTIGFLSLLGLPPFGGFIAKLTILKGLASRGDYLLIGAILVISLVEAIYLFRLLGVNLNRDKKERIELNVPLYKKIILSLLSIVILYLGIFPQYFLVLCKIVVYALIGVTNV
jgi:formate hydrogenlyase subunit 3/multisubunit Na+/H+ antiporter MnhD subunit